MIHHALRRRRGTFLKAGTLAIGPGWSLVRLWSGPRSLVLAIVCIGIRAADEGSRCTDTWSHSSILSGRRRLAALGGGYSAKPPTARGGITSGPLTEPGPGRFSFFGRLRTAGGAMVAAVTSRGGAESRAGDLHHSRWSRRSDPTAPGRAGVALCRFSQRPPATINRSTGLGRYSRGRRHSARRRGDVVIHRACRVPTSTRDDPCVLLDLRRRLTVIARCGRHHRPAS